MNDEMLRKVNSATKYPSIPTYHWIDPADGMLQPDLTLDWSGEVYATEKVDGTNARIIVLPSGRWLIGSRETLLTAEGDLVANHELGIVEGLLPIVDQVVATLHRTDGAVMVAFLEVFGQHGTSAYRQYGDGKSTGARLFDIATVPAGVLEMSRERIASWRDGGGQEFAGVTELGEQAAFMQVDQVPFLFHTTAANLPQSIHETAEFLTNLIPATRVLLSPEGRGGSEGMVLRSADRKLIAKLRHQDYQGTLRRQAQAGKLAAKEARIPVSDEDAALLRRAPAPRRNPAVTATVIETDDATDRPSFITLALYAEPGDVAASLTRFAVGDYLLLRSADRQWCVGVLRVETSLITRAAHNPHGGSPGERSWGTSGGVAVTEAVIERCADEAEAGHDPGSFSRTLPPLRGRQDAEAETGYDPGSLRVMRLRLSMEAELEEGGWLPPIPGNSGSWKYEHPEPLTGSDFVDCARRVIQAASLILGDDPAAITYEHANLETGPKGPLPCLDALTYAPDA